MLSFFRNTESSVRAHLDRIAFLMEFLEAYGLRDKDEVTRALQDKLRVSLPADDADLEERIWPDPSNSSLGIGFTCEHSKSSRRVKQFMLTGFGDIANTLVIGTAEDEPDGSVALTWSITPESESRPVPKISRKLQEQFWSLPGYTKIGFGQFNFLVRE